MGARNHIIMVNAFAFKFTIGTLVAASVLVAATETDYASSFKLFDEDEDGFLSSGDELSQALRVLTQRLSKAEIDKIVDAADDGDGEVSKDEFIRIMKDSGELIKSNQNYRRHALAKLDRFYDQEGTDDWEDFEPVADEAWAADNMPANEHAASTGRFDNTLPIHEPSVKTHGAVEDYEDKEGQEAEAKEAGEFFETPDSPSPGDDAWEEGKSRKNNMVEGDASSCTFFHPPPPDPHTASVKPDAHSPLVNATQAGYGQCSAFPGAATSSDTPALQYPQLFAKIPAVNKLTK